METSFVEWLDGLLESKEWSRADLSRKAQISEATLSMIYSGDRKPGLKTCRAIAKALELPENIVLAAAGQYEPITTDEMDFDEWKYVLAQMTPDERDELMAIARLKLDRRKKPPTKQKRNREGTPPLELVK